MALPGLSQLRARRNAVANDAPVAARKSLSSLLQTRNQMFLLVGGALLLSAVVWLLIVRPSSNKAESLRAEEDKQSQILTQMNKRIDQVSKVSQGASLAEQSYNKALAYDELLPLAVDQALVLREIPGMVAQAGLQLRTLSPQDESKEEKEQSDAIAARYNLVASGSLDGITKLLALLAESKPLITISSSTLGVVDPGKVENSDGTQQATAGGYELNLVIRVWSTKEPLLKAPDIEKKATDATVPASTDATVPASTPATVPVTTPTSPTTVPAGTATTVPASTATTVPVTTPAG